MNGYDEEDFHAVEKKALFKDFTVTYNGTLYDNQPYEIFLEAFKCIINEYKDRLNIKLYFPGLAVNLESAKLIREHLKGFENNYFINSRMPKEKVIDRQLRSHDLLMIG